MNSEPSTTRALDPAVQKKAGGKIAGRGRSAETAGRSRIEAFRTTAVVGQSGREWLKGRR